jgi:hypothetical protein
VARVAPEEANPCPATFNIFFGKFLGERMTNYTDLTEKRFGKLVAIKKVNKPENLKGTNSYWLCKCDCGKEKIIKGVDLIRNKSTSCGCNRRKEEGKASSHTVYSTYKIRAKEKNISFALSEEEFLEIVKKDCFYCGEKPSNIYRNGNTNGSFIYNGIDRIDSSIGYTKNNVVCCCKKCNWAKQKYSQKEFSDWVKKIYNYWASKY